jgi:hypothetical protein
MGVMQAINRHHVREFDTTRKPHHLGDAGGQAERMRLIQMTLRVLYRRVGISMQVVVPSVS